MLNISEAAQCPFKIRSHKVMAEPLLPYGCKNLTQETTRKKLSKAEIFLRSTGIYVVLQYMLYYNKKKAKAVPLQAWSGPEGSRKLRFPDFVTTQDGGRLSALHTGRFYLQEILLVLISVRY